MESVPIPPNKMEFLSDLLKQTGPLPDFDYHKDLLAEGKYSSYPPNIQVAIREMIRESALNKHGFDQQKWYSPAKEEGDDDRPKFLRGIVIGRDKHNEKIYRGKLEESPDKQYIEPLIVKPVYTAYDWHHLAYWRLGPLQDFDLTSSGCLVIPEAGVFLFKEEVERLKEGETVTPKHWGGFSGWGIFLNKLDTYHLEDGNLFRVWAYLTD